MDNNKLLHNTIRLLNKNNKKTFSKIKFFIKYNKKYKIDYMFWPNALLLYPLIVLNNKESKKYINKQLELINKNNNIILNFDDGLFIYLLMKYIPNNNSQIKKLEKNLFLYAKDYYNKVIPYRKNNPDFSLIDNLGMICPFLCLYGKNENNHNIIEWSIMQFEEFINNCYDKKSGLLYHGYNINTKKTFGALGWGRAMAWILLGLSESIVTLKNDEQYFKKLLDKYKLLINNVKRYINPTGGFDWIMSDKNEHLDTSVTSIILLTLLNLKKEKIIKEEYDNIIESLYKCLSNNTINGKVINCSAECKGLGNYPQKYGSYSWSVGPTFACVLLYNELKKFN